MGLATLGKEALLFEALLIYFLQFPHLGLRNSSSTFRELTLSTQTKAEPCSHTCKLLEVHRSASMNFWLPSAVLCLSAFRRPDFTDLLKLDMEIVKKKNCEEKD